VIDACEVRESAFIRFQLDLSAPAHGQRVMMNNVNTGSEITMRAATSSTE